MTDAPTPDPDVPPVSGELVAPPAATVQPSASQVRADAKGRLGNTSVQATIAGAVVTIGGYLCLQAGLDLDRLNDATRELPIPISNAFVVIGTIFVAWLMNRAGMKATDDDGEG